MFKRGSKAIRTKEIRKGTSKMATREKVAVGTAIPKATPKQAD
jgi:hypothetical protein